MSNLVRRAFLILWFVICAASAVHSSLQMLTTFAPQHRDDPALARVESEAIERVRNYWAGAVFVSSGLLVASSAGMAALGWRRGA